MASPEAVEHALGELVERLTRVDPRLRRSYLPSRRVVEAHVTDLDLCYHAVWEAGELGPVSQGAHDGRADVRLRATSDDLLALVERRLQVPAAYATGRLQIQAPMMDLLRLTTLW